MNTQALQQIFHTGMQMFDSTYQTFEEMRQLSLAPPPPTKKVLLENGQEMQVEDEEAKRKQRRLKALRWTLLLAVSFYEFVFVMDKGYFCVNSSSIWITNFCTTFLTFNIFLLIRTN